MALAFLRHLLRRRPILTYSASWAALLTTAVAVASLAPEVAFTSSIAFPPSNSSASARASGCGLAATSRGGGGRDGDYLIRLPMDGPTAACLPARFLRRSRGDVAVVPLFAALVVGGSACLVRAVGLWESEDQDD